MRTRYRQALTRNRAPRPGTGPARLGRAVGRPGNAGRQPGRQRSRTGAAGPAGPAKITVTIWHNVAFDDQGRHTATLDGYQPGDPVVRVFAYQASPGRSADKMPKRRSRFSTTTPGTPPRESWPAPTTGAGCGRCPSPESGCVARGRVIRAGAFVALEEAGRHDALRELVLSNPVDYGHPLANWAYRNKRRANLEYLARSTGDKYVRSRLVSRIVLREMWILVVYSRHVG